MPKFSIEKSATIDAPIEKVHASVRDFRQWPTWSPWLIAEPECQISYADDGNSYRWDGSIVGSGSMEVTDEESPTAIQYKLTFLKPWKQISGVQFSFQKRDGGTEATWRMDGSLPFFMFWMKSMMTALVGMDYERGLKMLKDFIETGSVPSQLDFLGSNSQTGFHYVGVKTQCTILDLGDRMAADLKKIQEWFNENNLQPAVNAFSIYHRWELVKGITEYTTGFPISASPGNLPSDFISGDFPTCNVYSIRHTGPYRHLGNAWASGMFRGRAKVFAQSKKIHPFETYENDPFETAENELITVVHFPTR
ncbi:MAG: hypothetical protein M2R45_05149 [Verrucomicrobia subdivision 3 bacterium]|nr:hypothetical protein [Limisphaerales bacterium]MCS1413792.1 hypothetical protein [Limisphaerales bacterium]